MAIRTDDGKVRKVINAPSGADFEAHIRTANAVVNYLVGKDTAGVLTDELLLAIETFLAAHYYAVFDPQYSSQGRDGASATYQVGPASEGFGGTEWGRQAVALDVTGVLASLKGGRPKATFSELGKAYVNRIDYDDRNY